ncbi:ABC transporter permease [Paenibacillus guangzhouensis]|uniref:ABC transporter permease n=1 Tax=Paenibacillus guangzhouensis TaxID=1473112 RepID=UPI001266D6BE|nr:ABC transporter permease [Paenibacillus guangzhouensis]
MNLNKLALNNVLRDKWTYFAYFINSAFSVFVFFSFSVAMFHPDLSLIQNGSSLSMVMIFGNILVYLFSFCFISYSIRSFLRSRIKTFGLFMITGASKKQMNAMIFKENMLIGTAAIIVAVIVGLVLSPLLLLVARHILNADGFAMYFPLKAILLTVVVFTILFTMIAYVTPMFLRKQTIMQMLTANRKGEREIKFSMLQLLLGLVLLGGIGVVLVFTDALSNTIGTFGCFAAFLLALYLFYRQGFVMILNLLRSRRLYKRKTNMLIIAELRSKLRSNVNVMYLVTLLFTATFLLTNMLYSVSTDVRKNVQRVFPFSYMYVSVQDNPLESKHIEMIRTTLEGKPGYAEYTYTMAYHQDQKGVGAVSESDYNAAAQGIGQPAISLQPDQMFVIQSSRHAASDQLFRPDSLITDLYTTHGLTPSLLGISNRSILVENYVRTLYVIPDNLMERAMQSFGSYMHVFAYHIDQWDRDKEPSVILGTKLKQEMLPADAYAFGFFDSYNLYQVEQTGKNLMLYVGSFISIIFFVAASSFIYFRMMTEKEKESLKFKGIVKLGLSRKELSTIISSQLAILMFVPFLLAIILTQAMIWLVSHEMSGPSGTYAIVALISTSIFLIIQIAGFLSVLSKYKNAMFKELYLNEMSS